MKSYIPFFTMLLTISASCSDTEPPNIVIIYTDDLGWSDLGCYGNAYHDTPHIDNLAEEGLRFTSAYAPAPICSASRASIMTGKSPARLQFEFVATNRRIKDKPLLPPKRTLELPLKEITLGEIGQNAGYTTAFFGKWHIAKHNGGYLKWSDTHGPFQQGFKVGSDHYGSHPYDKRNKPMVRLKPGEFPSDSLVERSIQFLRDQENKKQPFLMVFSSYYVHTPVAPNNDWLVKKYRDKMPAATENEVLYAAFVQTMDHYTGQVLQALDDYGFRENTVVIFTSDNGGHPGYTNNKPLRGNKWNLYEGGIREPFIIRWPGQVEGGKSIDDVVIQWDILPTLCELLGQPVPGDVDGVSLLPSVKYQKNLTDREFVYWHFPYYHPPKSYEGTKPCSAIREGDYKLLYFYEDQRLELYNLAQDIEESVDLSRQLPGLTDRLKTKLFEELSAVDARFAEPNPNFNATPNKDETSR